jgi:hypothetical protein
MARALRQRETNLVSVLANNPHFTSFTRTLKRVFFENGIPALVLYCVLPKRSTWSDPLFSPLPVSAPPVFSKKFQATVASPCLEAFPIVRSNPYCGDTYPHLVLSHPLQDESEVINLVLLSPQVVAALPGEAAGVSGRIHQQIPECVPCL